MESLFPRISFHLTFLGNNRNVTLPFKLYQPLLCQRTLGENRRSKFETHNQLKLHTGTYTHTEFSRLMTFVSFLSPRMTHPTGEFEVNNTIYHLAIHQVVSNFCVLHNALEAEKL